MSLAIFFPMPLDTPLPAARLPFQPERKKRRSVFPSTDTGKGIPSQYLPRIFEQFFRVPDQEKESGAGLGLAIVKEIIEAHGGTVGVESQEGKGSTFIFTLKTVDHLSKQEDHS